MDALINFFTGNFFLNYLIYAEIFVILAISTNLLVGVVGIFSVSQAAILGVGAYAYTIAVMEGLPFLAAMLIAILLCAAVNIVTSLPSLRLAGDYFVVTSFGIQIVATAIFINWTAVTGGAAGIFGIPRPVILGFATPDYHHFLALTTVCMVIGCVGYYFLMHSSYGRVLHAIRLNELAVVAAGRDILAHKLGVSAVSGAYAGAAGGLFAAFFSYIDPISFNIDVSVLVLTMFVVGGARTLAGSILGPFLLLAIPPILTMIPQDIIKPQIVGPLRALIYGLLLIFFMLLRPQGIAGRKL